MLLLGQCLIVCGGLSSVSLMLPCVTTEHSLFNIHTTLPAAFWLIKNEYFGPFCQLFAAAALRFDIVFCIEFSVREFYRNFLIIRQCSIDTASRAPPHFVGERLRLLTQKQILNPFFSFGGDCQREFLNQNAFQSAEMRLKSSAQIVCLLNNKSSKNCPNSL